MFRSLMVLIALFFLFPNQVRASDGDYLSTKALKKLLQNKTAYAYTLKDKTKWQLKFRSDGQAVFTYSNGSTKTVVYRFESNSICMDFSAEAENICRKLLKSEGGYLWVNAVTGKSSSEIYEVNNKDRPVVANKPLQENIEKIKKENKETVKIVSSSRPSRITSVAYSPSGEYFIAGSKDNTIRLWEASTRKQIRTFIGHTGSVNSVAYSPDGEFIISGSDDMTIRLWDARTGNVRHIFKGHTGAINSVDFSSKGKLIASGSTDTNIRVWNVETKKLKFILDNHKESVNSVVFSPDGKLIASGSGIKVVQNAHTEQSSFGEDTTVKIWDATNASLVHTLEGHAETVNSVAFSINGKILSGTRDGSLWLWETRSGKLEKKFTIDNKIVKAHEKNSPDPKKFKHEEIYGPETGGINAVKFSSDGNTAIASYSQINGFHEGEPMWSGVSIFNTKTGQHIENIHLGIGDKFAIDISEDGASFLAGNITDLVDLNSDEKCFQYLDWAGCEGKKSAFNILNVWNISTKKSIQQKSSDFRNINSIKLSHDNKKIISGDGVGQIRIWNLEAGKASHLFQGHRGMVKSLDITKNNTRIISAGDDRKIKLWDIKSGQELVASLTYSYISFINLKFSKFDDSILVAGKWKNAGGQSFVSHYRLKDNTKIKLPEQETKLFTDAVKWKYSPDGKLALVAHMQEEPSDEGVFYHLGLKLWNIGNNKVLDFATGKPYDTSSEIIHFTFSPDSSKFIFSIQYYMDADDKKRRAFEIKSVPDGKLLKRFSNTPLTEAELFELSPDNKTIVAKFPTGEISLWSAFNGKRIKKLEGVLGKINVLQYTPDGTRIITGGADGKINIWDAQSGKMLLTLIGGTDKDDWLAITPEGFFNASSKGRGLISVVKGFESFDINQVYDHLYRPDLVKEALSGDKQGKLKDAAYKLNLEKIMASGPAPQLELKTPKTELAGSSVKLSIRVTDAGGGISNKIIWRVNGKTQGDVLIPGGPIEDAVTVTQGLQLDPRQKNIITVTAYNEAGLLASVPLEITVDSQGGVDIGDRPRMHVLSIGIDKYEQPDYQLNYAVGDASAVGKMLKTVASSLYDKVEVTYLTDKEVTRGGLEKVFSKIAPKVKPQDVFVLYVAGHGKSVAGTYYYLPQDLSFKAGHGILTHGIGQDLWQKWLAKITANKSVLIFDTCESTEATKIRSATNIERETALDRLRHAHGHSSITAARKAAHEGYKGHGVLTYTILEALSKTVNGKEKEVDLSDLAKHINLRVPVISKQEFGSIQRPHNKIDGDFPFGIATKGVLKAAKETIPSTPTHVIIQKIKVRETPSIEAKSNRKLEGGYQVFVVKYYKDWALIARDGVKLGYVPQKALFKLQ
ncbi:MAG: eIF2A-related protein [Rhodomicrobiaceae bacterium]